MFGNKSQPFLGRRGRDLKSHRIKPWAWFLWIGFDVLLVSYTVKSTYDVWPKLLWLAVLGGGAVLVGSLYVAAHSYDALNMVRHRATVGALWLTLALLLNVLGHGAVSRNYSTAQELRAEQMELFDKTSKVAADERRDMGVLLDKQTGLANANAKIDENAARRNESERRFYKSTGRIKQASPGAAAVTVAPITGFKPTQVVAVTASPAATAETWFWWVFGGFAIELIASAVVSTWVKKATLKDLNNNGIIDSEEEADSTALVRGDGAPKTKPSWIN